MRPPSFLSQGTTQAMATTSCGPVQSSQAPQKADIYTIPHSAGANRPGSERLCVQCHMVNMQQSQDTNADLCSHPIDYTLYAQLLSTLFPVVPSARAQCQPTSGGPILR